MKENKGNFFEDFKKGQLIKHAVPRTITEGDSALYIALTGDRHPLHCDAEYARKLGFARETVNDLLVFHIVFGKTVNDISLNAVANLGYADVRFIQSVYSGDTLRAETEVVGLRETSAGNSGIVYARSRGLNQNDEIVMEFYRWVLVHKKDANVKTDTNDKVNLPKEVLPENLPVARFTGVSHHNTVVTGGKYFYGDYEKGERVYHQDGMTLNDTDHSSATRLYQNTARVHFDALKMQESRFKKRLVYGGHVISIAYAMSFNGFENAAGILAWNGGTHANPAFAGDTIYAFTEVLDKKELPQNPHLGALRLRLVAVKNEDPQEKNTPVMVKNADGKEAYHPSVALDLDYWVAVARK